MAAVVQTQSLASQLLAAIGAPTTTPNIAAMTAWLNSESTHTASTITAVGNNPLNISTAADVSGKVIGTTAVGPGIAQYSSVATGVQATAQYLTARQPNIIAGFKTGTGTSAITAITASNYVTGGNGGNQYGGNLLGRYQGVLSNLVSSTSSTTPNGGASTPLTATPSQTNPSSTGPLGIANGTVITDSTIATMVSAILKLPGADTASPSSDALTSIISKYKNATWNTESQAAVTKDIQSAIPQNSPFYTGVGSIIGSTSAVWPAASGASTVSNALTSLDVPGALTLIGVIAVGAVLILTGGIITLKRK
jgi:hypothetical protein